MRRPIVNAIWIGRRLGPIHAACLKSFLVTGHHVVLHSYGEVEDAPAGVRHRDANKLMPEDKLLRYPNGSYAISANLMRYEILRQGIGLYVDCDVFCLRPMEDADYIFGWEAFGSINNAVLKLPKRAPVVDDLSSIQPGWIPPWWGDPEKVVDRLLPDMPWGTTGPAALTHYLDEHDLLSKAMPYDAIYPVHWNHWDILYDPGLTIEDVTTSRTHYLHLWNNEATGHGQVDIPPTSPIGRLIRRVEEAG